MLALQTDSSAPGGFAFAEVPDPTPGPGQVLIEVRRVALNFLDVAYSGELLGDKAVVGVDAAGKVLRAAADGSGPPTGALVTTFAGGGAFAPLRAVDTVDLAVVPPGVDLTLAAALPAAGVTALQAVRRLGALLGKSVLITGASGGVGQYAVQLAALAGAHVTAAVGRPERAAGLRELGAHDTVTNVAGLAAVDAIIDNVGGELLAQALDVLRPSGLCLSVGSAAGLPTTLDLERHRRRGGNWSLVPFAVQGPFGPDLQVLLDLVRDGRLAPQIGWRGSWRQAREAMDALQGRRVAGKAVLGMDLA